MATLPIILRGLTVASEETREYKPDNTKVNFDRVFVFDTETTIDKFQNLRIGCAQVYLKGFLQYTVLFFNDKMLTSEEIEELQKYGKGRGYAVCSLEYFIERIFYKEVYYFESLCVGFNLPFDVSRLAIKTAASNGKKHEGFTFTLCENIALPKVRIRALGDKEDIEFLSTPDFCKKNKRDKKKKRFKGYFLDISHLAKVILQEKHTLETLSRTLNVKHKKVATEEHGIISTSYLDYAVNDVVCTYECYIALMKELKGYNLPISPVKIYSSASLGKSMLEKLGVLPYKSLSEPLLSTLLKGNIMSAYYGGRCECKHRLEPVRVSVLDFTSMYPTINVLMDLWKYITVSKYHIIDYTEETRELLQKVSLEYLQNKEVWKEFTVFVKFKPEEDILPIRQDFTGTGKEPANIAINQFTYNKSLWYALPDVISSVLLRGKIPQIEEAIKFDVAEKQQTLQKAVIAGCEVDPLNTNPFKFLVEKRQLIKQEIKTLLKSKTEEEQEEIKKSSAYAELKNREQALKILLNSTSYGITIELNPEDKVTENVTIQGCDDSFTTNEANIEKEGKYFNPVVGVLITSASHLFLAMGEAFILRESKGKETHKYMDTDSIFCSPEYAKALCEYFNALNPYNRSIVPDLLKIEIEDMLFYGISSKRYAVYEIKDGDIVFESKDGKTKGKYMLHGLGQYSNPFKDFKGNWQEEIWRDILRIEHGLITYESLFNKYSHAYALTKKRINTPYLLSLYKHINEGAEYEKQIKPYSFFIEGYDNGSGIVPVLDFNKNPEKQIDKDFVDKHTNTLIKGSVQNGPKYFKDMSGIISNYMKHPENKFKGQKGQLERKHVKADRCKYTGKEIQLVDENDVVIKGSQIFTDTRYYTNGILGLTFKDVKHIGIGERTLREIKQKIRLGCLLNWEHGSVKKLADYLENC